MVCAAAVRFLMTAAAAGSAHALLPLGAVATALAVAVKESRNHLRGHIAAWVENGVQREGPAGYHSSWADVRMQYMRGFSMHRNTEQ